MSLDAFGEPGGPVTLFDRSHEPPFCSGIVAETGRGERWPAYIGYGSVLVPMASPRPVGDPASDLLYLRFTLGCRDVEELLAHRGLAYNQVESDMVPIAFDVPFNT